MSHQKDKFNLSWLQHVNAVLPLINRIHGCKLNQNQKRFCDLVEKLLKNHGRTGTIKKLKSFRVALQQYVLKQHMTEIPFCKTDRDHFPIVIKFLKPNLEDIYSIRYSLSVMRIIDGFRCEPKYEVNTILESSKGDKSLIDEIKKYLPICPALRRFPKLGHSAFVNSNKAGPNGPASVTAMRDLAALLQDPKLYDNIKQMMRITFPEFASVMHRYKPHKGEWKHSKLVLLSDKACKTRVIAIADWWTNTSLSAIHNAFMGRLKSLPSDVTFRQADIPKLVKSLGPHLFSSDMTAFTDRFPIELEVHVLNAVFGDNIGDLWKQIISNRYFYHPKGDVKYNCGNPMGVLSSWPVSTLTHHVVKQWCAYKLGISKYKYLILGDDTLDSDENVYKLYIQTIQRLGVSISIAKSTQSYSGNTEFAKRLFRNHEEITGIPVDILRGINKFPEQVLELVRIARERGYSDQFLEPSLASLLANHRYGKLIASMLSLPESVTGSPPLLKVVPGSTVDLYNQLPEDLKTLFLRYARDKVFWERAGRIDNTPLPKKTRQLPVEEDHPLVAVISDKLMVYLQEGDEYSIYNAWQEGNYRELVDVPNLDTYRYYNRNRHISKCRFDVLRNLLDLVNGNCNITLVPHKKLSNMELFQLAYKTVEAVS